MSFERSRAGALAAFLSVAKHLPPKPSQGPGTELRRILKSIGITDAIGCGCEALARKMDAWGADGCREHLDEIVAKMEATASKRDWLRFAPFKSLGARLLVERAIAACGETR